MRKIILFLWAASLCLTGFANTKIPPSIITQSQKALKSSNHPFIKKAQPAIEIFNCSSTMSWTESGQATDCSGNVVNASVTSSCTASASTCVDADTNAFICAVIKARNALAAFLMFDCG